MAISAKFALPSPSHTNLSQPAFERSIGGATLFSAQAGFVLTERFAVLIKEQKTPFLWVRLGAEDRDPASLLVSLVTAVSESFPTLSASVLEQMRKQPGPLFGWGSLFAGFARELAAALPGPPTQPLSFQPENMASTYLDTPFTIIIEHVDQLNPAPHTLALLWDHFLPHLPTGSTRLLTRHADPPREKLPGYIHRIEARNLQLDERSCLALAHDSCVRLPVRTLHRMNALASGREVVISGLLSACHLLSSDTIQQIIETANNLPDLLSRIARRCLDTSLPGTADLLTLALRLEHLNPALVQAAVGKAVEPPELFLQSLSGSWARLRCTWKDPLRSIIRPGETMGQEMLQRAARFLIHQGDYQQAIPLLLDLGEPHEAARVIVQMIEPMVDLGQWETLAGWLKRLPEAVRHDWPWLVYTEGELAAARGQSRAARRTFSVATQLFQEHKDLKGTCQSLLTESCLSAWQNDLEQAEAYARQTRSLAEKAGLSWYQGWADWQLGCLSASAGRLAESLAFFHGAAQSAESSGDPQMTAFINQATQLIQTQIEQQRIKAQHIQAYYEADRVEHDAAGRMQFLLENPAGQADDLLGLYGWSRTPLFLKLPPPSISSSFLSSPDRILGLLKTILRPAGRTDSEVLSFPGKVQAGTLVGGTGEQIDPSPATLPVTGYSSPSNSQEDGSAAQLASDTRPDPIPNTSPQSPPYALVPIKNNTPAASTTARRLDAYLLGNFKVLFDENVINTLPNNRGRAIFAYLLFQRNKPVPREVIMDTFWPDAAPESARNSLNVAIYNLRQSLKTILNMPVILFQENAYLLNPALTFWLDTSAFEESVQAGHQHEASGQVVESTRDYERALSLYQGDLLVDFPYEDWVALERERLRILYLETLDRLSLIYFNQGQYAACVTLCQRMLSNDTSREDAHCRLMRCFARQGQVHLAVRQYQACIEALRTELDVEPSPATIKIYDQIRRREPI
jgi:DNA-binding SARP family transcriptional activator